MELDIPKAVELFRTKLETHPNGEYLAEGFNSIFSPLEQLTAFERLIRELSLTFPDFIFEYSESMFDPDRRIRWRRRK